MKGNTRKKTLPRRMSNRLLHLITRFCPGATSFRPLLHRLRGVKIYGRVLIGDDVYIENEYPEAVEIFDEAQISLRTTIIAHFRGPGRIVIGRKVWIGTGCIITASPGETVTLGEGSALAAGSVVTKDVAPYTLVAGVPARPIAKIQVPMTLETSYEDFKKGLIRFDE